MLGYGAAWSTGYFAADATMDGLLGPFDTYGGSGGPPPGSIGGDYSTAGGVDVYDLAVGLSLGTPLEVHWGQTTTALLFDDPELLRSPVLWPIWTGVEAILFTQGLS